MEHEACACDATQQPMSMTSRTCVGSLNQEKHQRWKTSFYAHSEIIEMRTCICILTQVILQSDSWTEIHNILEVKYHRHLLSFLKVC